MAKPNYSFEKRQRELAKKEKKVKKEREKADRKTVGGPGEGTAESSAGGESNPPAAPAMGPTGG